MTFHSTIAALIFCTVSFAHIQTPTPSPSASPAPPADLAVMIKVLSDPASPVAQRNALIGKSYTGTVVVSTVRLDPTDRNIAIIVTEPKATGDLTQPARIQVRLIIAADDPKLPALQRGAEVKIQGKLKEIAGSVATFSDVTFDPAR